MHDKKEIFNILNLNESEIAVYTALLHLSSSSIRKIADKSSLNRGITYNCLKSLEKKGLVSYYHKEKKQHFVAEEPQVLRKILERKKNSIEEAEVDIQKIIDEFSSLNKSISSRPVVKFYENYFGVRNILESVLDEVIKLPKKEYAVFSSSTIRPYLYHKSAFPGFSLERIKRKIHVRTIASGEGGQTYGKDERKWLSKKETAPTYKLIYANKVAMISVGKNNIPHGLIIEDEALYQTELSIFNELWKNL